MSQASLFEFFKWMLFNLFEMFKWMLFNWAKEQFYICVEVAGGSALCIFPTIISECQRVRKALSLRIASICSLSVKIYSRPLKLSLRWLFLNKSVIWGRVLSRTISGFKLSWEHLQGCVSSIQLISSTLLLAICQEEDLPISLVNTPRRRFQKQHSSSIPTIPSSGERAAAYFPFKQAGESSLFWASERILTKRCKKM